MDKKKFKMLMLGAMYENGGNTTHRLLDGHPELFVYPFESQPGSKFVNDYLTSMFPIKYRWPIFPTSSSAFEMYKLIIDEEGKVRARTPNVSKFRHADFMMNDDTRCEYFCEYLREKELSRANVMEAFFVATFETWQNFNRSNHEKMYVGYSPIIGIDGDKIIEDFKGNGYVLHVVRNPFSAYSDTSKRPVPLNIAHYMTGWTLNQYYANIYAEKYPNNFFILRFEDIIQNPKLILGNFLQKIGINGDYEGLSTPSWNGEPLQEVYPWGTVRIPKPEVNLATAKELNKSQIAEIYERTKLYIDKFDYASIMKSIM
jgi:hypothetical protein